MVLYTHTMTELRPQNHNRDGLLGPNSTMVVYMDPLGLKISTPCKVCWSGSGQGAVRELGLWFTTGLRIRLYR